MKKFIVEIKESNSNIEIELSITSMDYQRELIVAKNDSKFLELDSCIKNFTCWYLGDKFAEVKTINSSSFEVLTANR